MKRVNYVTEIANIDALGKLHSCWCSRNLGIATL